MFLCEIIPIQCHGNVQQAVKIDQRLAFWHIAKARNIRHFPFVLFLGTFKNRYTQYIVAFDFCLIEQSIADIAPNIAVLDIQNRDITFQPPLLWLSLFGKEFQRLLGEALAQPARM